MGDRWIRYTNILPLLRAHQRHHLTEASAHSNHPSPGGDQPYAFLTWQRHAWMTCWTEMKTVSRVFSENTPRTSGPPAPLRVLKDPALSEERFQSTHLDFLLLRFQPLRLPDETAQLGDLCPQICSCRYFSGSFRICSRLPFIRSRLRRTA